MTFFDKLVAETKAAREELYSVPQLAAGLQGDISKETYINYLTQAFHHVKHTVPFLMSMGTRLDDKHRWLHDVAIEYMEEEVGHEEWILNDIETIGGDKEAARNEAPSLATQCLVAYNYDYIARKNPVGFLGMVYMLESTSTQIATKGADALKDSLKLDEKAFSYLYSHGVLDLDHMKFLEKTLNKITDEADQQAILEVACNTFLLFANVMRSIPFQGEVERAA